MKSAAISMGMQVALLYLEAYFFDICPGVVLLNQLLQKIKIVINLTKEVKLTYTIKITSY
jgi:hypothetical protein